jgi:hypothetical protein
MYPVMAPTDQVSLPYLMTEAEPASETFNFTLKLDYERSPKYFRFITHPLCKPPDLQIFLLFRQENKYVSLTLSGYVN